MAKVAVLGGGGWAIALAKVLYENGTDAVLIGETLMRSADKKTALDQLRQGK